jgi:hypothetical protein
MSNRNGLATCVSTHATDGRTGCEAASDEAGCAGEPETPARGDAWWQRRRRAAVLAWSVLLVVLWNVVFDGAVIQSGRDYLTQQALHQQGRGPAVTIPGVMRPGIARGFWLATLVTGGAGALGAVLFWAAGRQRRRQIGEEPAEAGSHDSLHSG